MGIPVEAWKIFGGHSRLVVGWDAVEFETGSTEIY